VPPYIGFQPRIIQSYLFFLSHSGYDFGYILKILTDECLPYIISLHHHPPTNSGYDFGYLLKILTNECLPAEESDFFELLFLYFPKIYDVKYLMKSCKSLKGGLQEVSELLELERIGPQHQAGSDSLLTGAAFFKMREMFFEDNIDDDKYCGHLFGLGASYSNGATALAYREGQQTESATPTAAT